MKKNTALKIVNPILGILLLCQVLTGLLHSLLPRDVFEILHQANGIALALVASIHLILNWNWVKASFFQRTPAVVK